LADCVVKVSCVRPASRDALHHAHHCLMRAAASALITTSGAFKRPRGALQFLGQLLDPERDRIALITYCPCALTSTGLVGAARAAFRRPRSAG